MSYTPTDEELERLFSEKITFSDFYRKHILTHLDVLEVIKKLDIAPNDRGAIFTKATKFQRNFNHNNHATTTR